MSNPLVAGMIFCLARGSLWQDSRSLSKTLLDDFHRLRSALPIEQLLTRFVPGVWRLPRSRAKSDRLSLELAVAEMIGSGDWKSIALMVAAEYCLSGPSWAVQTHE